MSSIFLLFVESLWSYKSKRSKKRDQENRWKGLERYHSRIPREALQTASQINGGGDSVKGGSQ